MVGSPQVGGPFPVDGIIMIFLFFYFFISWEIRSHFFCMGELYLQIYFPKVICLIMEGRGEKGSDGQIWK